MSERETWRVVKGDGSMVNVDVEKVTEPDLVTGAPRTMWRAGVWSSPSARAAVAAHVGDVMEVRAPYQLTTAEQVVEHGYGAVLQALRGDGCAIAAIESELPDLAAMVREVWALRGFRWVPSEVPADAAVTPKTDTVTPDEARTLLGGTTEEPWLLCDDGEILVETESGRRLAVVTDVGGPRDATGRSETTVANAALLARAPALARTVVAQGEEIAHSDDDRDRALQLVGMADGHARLLAQMVTAGAIREARVGASFILSDPRPEVELGLDPEGRQVLKGWPVMALAHGLHELIIDQGVENFCEWSITAAGYGFTITVQRADGKSPGQMRREATEAADLLRATLASTAAKYGALVAAVRDCLVAATADPDAGDESHDPMAVVGAVWESIKALHDARDRAIVEVEKLKAEPFAAVEWGPRAAPDAEVPTVCRYFAWLTTPMTSEYDARKVAAAAGAVQVGTDQDTRDGAGWIWWDQPEGADPGPVIEALTGWAERCQTRGRVMSDGVRDRCFIDSRGPLRAARTWLEDEGSVT